MLYAPRACTAPPVHSVTQSCSCYIYIIITTPCRYCRQCYTRMLYATLRASRFALRLLSHHIIYITHVHTGRCYGIESYHSSNKYISTAIPQPCARITTEKVNPFFTITNQAGGWVISKSFPLRGCGFKMRV